MLVEAGADYQQLDRHNRNLLHYAVQSNNEKLCKYLLSKNLNSKEIAQMTNMVPKSYAVRAVARGVVEDLGPCGVGLVHDPLRNEYLEAARAIKKAETYKGFMTGGEAVYAEDKIYNMILR